MRIEKISAQAFRGFPSEVHFRVSEKLTLIAGENGTGKTSVSEAFEWALYGEVARKERSQTKSEYEPMFLRSAHAEDDCATWAEVALVDGDGKKYKIRRVLLPSGQNKLFINGKEAQSVEEVGVPIGPAFRPVLGQSEIKSFLDTQQKDRWIQISSILGLGGFEKFREKLMEIHNTAKAQGAVQRIHSRANILLAPFLLEGEEAQKVNPDHVKQRITDLLGLEQKVDWETIINKAEQEITNLIKRDKYPKVVNQLVQGSEKLAEEVDFSQAVAGVLSEAAAHKEWHEKNKHTRFVKSGVEITSLPKCPFCGEDTLTKERMAALQSKAASLDPQPSDGEKKLSELISALSEALSGPVNTKVTPALVDTLGEESELGKATTALTENQNKLSEAYRNFQAFSEGFKSALSSGDAEELSRLAEDLISRAGEIILAYNNLRSESEGVKSKIEAAYSDLTEDEQRRLEKLQQIKQLAAGINTLSSSWGIQSRQDELQAFIRLLETTEKESVASLVEELSSDVKEYYEKLSPDSNLSFEGIQVKGGVRRQAKLEAKAYGKDVNPASMFSEAQGNCLSLSLYFSQRVKRNPTWGAIVLDDPVQSMDERHEDALVNLLQEISTTHQVIVLSHEKPFAKMIERRFLPSGGFLHYVFNKNPESPTPKIRVSHGRFDDLAHQCLNLSKGDDLQRESAGTVLRKALENFVIEIADSKGEKPPRGHLEEQLQTMRRLRWITEEELGVLDTVRSFTNPISHESERVRYSEPAIKTHLRNLIETRKNYQERLDTPTGS